MSDEIKTAGLEEAESQNFIHQFIQEDMSEGGRCAGMQVHTRFPPEPNGYLHIGHCKAEFVDAIKEDIHWLGFDWGDRFFYGSDYFEKTYELAVGLIKKGLAYVCELTPEQFREYRGDVNTPARSPWRDRPVEESLDLFQRMRNGEFPEGKYTLRAKIDLALEYEDHRPLYDWVINNTDVPSKPRQIEFARLGINYTVMSKRKLRKLVEENYVSGWDDPRMPTLCGLRRRGYTPAAIRSFCDRIGVAKNTSTVEYGFLEHCLREDLNDHARRVMAVLRPVKLVITNYPAGQSETLTVENNPLDPSAGTREVTFSRELWVEAEDFLPEPVPKYKRLYPGGPECRLKGAYLIKCVGYETDEAGNVIQIAAEYDPDSRGGNPADGRKVKGATIHWVDAATAVDAQVRLYDNLFADENPDGGDRDFLECLNPGSLEVLTGCKLEASLAAAQPADRFQFLRLGYFCADSKDSRPGALVFNRAVSLKDGFKTGK